MQHLIFGLRDDIVWEQQQPKTYRPFFFAAFFFHPSHFNDFFFLLLLQAADDWSRVIPATAPVVHHLRVWILCLNSAAVQFFFPPIQNRDDMTHIDPSGNIFTKEKNGGEKNLNETLKKKSFKLPGAIKRTPTRASRKSSSNVYTHTSAREDRSFTLEFAKTWTFFTPAKNNSNN